METTIQIDSKTRDRLKEQWQHGDDTYDSVVNKLLDIAEKKK